MPNYKNLADELWSTVIRQVGKCEMCERIGIKGKKQGWHNLIAHHIIFRTHLEYRYDLSNGLCLCSRCHKWVEWAPHQNEQKFLAWLEMARPGQYQWYLDNTMEKTTKIGNKTFISRIPLRRDRGESYQESCERLKEMI